MCTSRHRGRAREQRGGDRNRRRDSAARLGALLTAALLLAACGQHRHPTPRDPVEVAALPPSTTTPPVQPAAVPPERVSLAPPPPEALLGDDIPPSAGAALRLVERARQQRAAGDPNGARETLERAVEIDPTCAFAYYDLADLHLEYGHAEQAAAFAEKALTVGASYGGEWLSHAQVLLGKALQASGKEDAAADCYRRALALDAGNLPARVALQALQ